MRPRPSAGLVFQRTRLMTQDDFQRFADLSGDSNPIHVDPAFAAATHFGGTVSHGMLLYSMLGAFLAGLFPGARQERHEMVFPSGTRAGEQVTWRVEVLAYTAGRDAHVAVQALRPGGELGLGGETWLRWPSADGAQPGDTAGRQPAQQEDRASSAGDSGEVREAPLELSMQASLTRAYTLADRARYRELAGDDGDDLLAGRPAVPPALIGGLFSTLLGTVLPGFGTNYLKQIMTFPRPARYDAPLTATVRVVRLRPEKGLVNLETTCVGQAGDVVCAGEALVLARERFARV